MENDSHKTYNILIVDDVPDNIKIAANILQREDYELSFATSSNDALDKVNSNKFDLILLDIMMPEMDGFQVGKQIKSNPATNDIPIIFLTAKTDTESIVKGFELGAVDYVTKPFNSAELLARVKTHLTLQHAKEELQELNATKDKFFSIIAHDLRGPFTALFGLTELLKEKLDHYSKDETKNIVNELQNSAKTVHTLLENLLTWSRLQRNIMEHFPDSIPLADIARHNILLFQLTADQKQISLRNLIQEETMVYADFDMVDTVLRNLIANAIKFTDIAGTIEMSAKEDEQSVEIAVSDTGIGISEENISKLFRIDVKQNNVGTAGERGTGLGLLLCKELVKKNSGRIWVESELGKGSTFRFTLPKGKSSDSNFTV
jgi:two-component system sensor histidine kinase/response regulator